MRTANEYRFLLGVMKFLELVVLVGQLCKYTKMN